MYSIIIKQSSFAVLSHAKIIQWASQDIKMRTETVRQDGLRGKKTQPYIEIEKDIWKYYKSLGVLLSPY